ncbi:hypothetical protein LCGC14_0347450 [marine sediment metagenome]|uniref:Uncharacterized protein n=1 Tax=marine sediment metagenome TaxID=412755 RepID=A0A0F9WJN1_9ZZZZ
MYIIEPISIPLLVLVALCVTVSTVLVAGVFYIAISIKLRRPITLELEEKYKRGHEQGYRDALEDSKRSDKTSFHAYRKK